MFDTKFHYPTVTSTNDVAKELLSSGQYTNLVVSANEQTKGRGRSGNVWDSPVSVNLYMSFGLRHLSEQKLDHLLTYQAAGCLSVYGAVKELFPSLDVKIKYPNDVYLSSKATEGKIAGVLVENEFSGSQCISSIIGIGLNINQGSFPADIQNKATSLKIALERELVYEEILKLQVLITERFSDYAQKKWVEMYPLWKNILKLRGKTVQHDGKDYVVEDVLNTGQVVLTHQHPNENSATITISPNQSLTYVP